MFDKQKFPNTLCVRSFTYIGDVNDKTGNSSDMTKVAIKYGTLHPLVVFFVDAVLSFNLYNSSGDFIGFSFLNMLLHLKINLHSDSGIGFFSKILAWHLYIS